MRRLLRAAIAVAGLATTLSFAAPALADTGPWGIVPQSNNGNPYEFVTNPSGPGGLDTEQPHCTNAAPPAAGTHIVNSFAEAFNKPKGSGDYLVAPRSAAKRASAPCPNQEWWVSANGSYSKIHQKGAYNNCWTKSGNNLIVSDCMQGNNSQLWDTPPGTTELEQHSTGNFVGVFDPFTSRPVYVQNKMTGYYVSWAFYQGP